MESSFQFLKGFIAGQLVLFVFAFAVFHYMFLQGPLDLRRRKRKADGPVAVKRDDTTGRALVYRDILEKFSYSPGTAHAETCQWLNILVAQVLTQMRSSAHFHGLVESKLHALFTRFEQSVGTASTASTTLQDFKLAEFHLGSGLPRISSAKWNHSESGRLRCDLRLEYGGDGGDDLSVTCQGVAVSNWPIEQFAALPFQLGVSLTGFSGTLSIEILEPSIEGVAQQDCRFQITFLHDATFDLQVGSTLGHRTKLKDMSKLAEVLIAFLRASIEEEIVWPNHVTIGL
eukprot:Partr_v1_DN27277_c0_g2_i2_m38620 putative Component of the ERMES MDM complex, which serves as a molecular tether to connect the endoplasmic reticulum and mitochondria. Components of this complex are involved in the control of mitochondrial shape and protein biogenesis and may function in phospholipid exchange. The mdm12-mmm1 subcomplex functions in the major beta-barrel assembly pathway that is responsible for biogenesis of all outer membrane beta-barrel proteins, and acts in a late step after t